MLQVSSIYSFSATEYPLNSFIHLKSSERKQNDLCCRYDFKHSYEIWIRLLERLTNLTTECDIFLKNCATELAEYNHLRCYQTLPTLSHTWKSHSTLYSKNIMKHKVSENSAIGRQIKFSAVVILGYIQKYSMIRGLGVIAYLGSLSFRDQPLHLKNFGRFARPLRYSVDLV